VKRFIYCGIILTLLFISLNAYAADGMGSDIYEQDSQQAFGIHFGNVSGSGLAYRYFLDKVGFQGVLGGYSSGNNTYSFRDSVFVEIANSKITLRDKGRRYSMNLGANVIYPLKKTDLFIFYLTGGLCWKYFNYKYYKQDYLPTTTTSLYYQQDPDGVYSNRDIKSYVNFGFGPGVEIKAGKFFKLSIELPVTYTGKHEFIMYVPAVGIYYYFK